MKIKIWVLFVLVSLFVLPVMGQEQQSLIKVTGVSKGKYMPDMIRLTLAIKTEAVSQKDAILLADVQFDKLIKKLIASGIDPKDIKIKRNYFGRGYECDDITPALFYASKVVEIDMIYDRNSFLKIADSIATFEIPELIFSYSFIFSDSFKDKIKKELIKKATNDAFEIIQLIADQKNLKVGEVVSISYYSSSSNYSTDYYEDDMNYNNTVNSGVNSRYSPELSHKEKELSEKVDVQVRIKTN